MNIFFPKIPENGDIVVSLVPLNSSCAWVTPASFKATLVPEELMDPSLTLTVEEYVHAMRILTNDFRFTLYTIMYKRVIFFWISLGFILLLTLLFSGTTRLSLSLSLLHSSSHHNPLTLSTLSSSHTPILTTILSHSS